MSWRRLSRLMMIALAVSGVIAIVSGLECRLVCYSWYRQAA